MRVIFISVAFFAVFLFFVSAALADETGKCITGKCHQGMLDKKFVHGPVAVQECGSCHKRVGSHKFVLAAKVPRLCTICHDEKKMIGRPGCGCHDPHGSDNPYQLVNGAGKNCK
jgi:predicted CXXCH cytochrome family protein